LARGGGFEPPWD